MLSASRVSFITRFGLDLNKRRSRRSFGEQGRAGRGSVLSASPDLTRIKTEGTRHHNDSLDARLGPIAQLSAVHGQAVSFFVARAQLTAGPSLQ